jgi:hypothetical protein
MKPCNIYKGKVIKVFYYTDKKGKLSGSYITREAAKEGLRIYIKEQKEKEEEIEKEKLTPHHSSTE